MIPFWKKCSKSGHKFEKKNVWHGKENTFVEESMCSKCGFTLEPEQVTTQIKNPEKTRPLDPVRIYEQDNEPKKRQPDKNNVPRIPFKQYRVEEAYHDEREKLASIDFTDMNISNLLADGIIEIKGKTQTVAKYSSLRSADEGKKIIRLDEITRFKLGVKVGEYVMIRRVDELPVDELLILARAEINSIGDEFLSEALENTPVATSDEIRVSEFGKTVRFQIIGVSPEESNVVTKQTKFVRFIKLEDGRTVRDSDENKKMIEESQIIAEQTREKNNVKISFPDAVTSVSSGCATPDCKTKLYDLNSKHCKLCNQRVCIDHLQLHINKFCPKTMYVKYIRKLWLMKRGQNVSSGTYSIVCETCGYVSDFPQLIEYAGQELKSHLDNNPECKANKKTFLEEFDFEPIPKGVHVESSIVRDPNRTLWVCAHCRPPRKFTNHDEYIAHHYTHS